MDMAASDVKAPAKFPRGNCECRGWRSRPGAVYVPNVMGGSRECYGRPPERLVRLVPAMSILARQLGWGVPLVALAAVCAAAPCARAQWVPNGLRLGPSDGSARLWDPVPISDGVGGAFIGARDVGVSADAVRLLRLGVDGTPPVPWTISGIRFPLAAYPSGDMWNDGCLQSDGSITVARRRGPDNRIYLTRIRPDGSPAPGWDPAFQAAPGVSSQDLAQLCPTPDGGNFVIWQAGGLYSWDVWMTRLTAAGQTAPGWPAAGHEVGAGPNFQYATSPVVSDGGDGAWIAYYSSDGAAESDVLVLRTDGLGNPAPGFPLYGLQPTHAAGVQAQPWLCRDGGDGAFVAWCDARSGVGIPEPQVQAYYDIYLQHLTGTGEVAPGWPADGLPVCVWPGSQQEPQLLPDGNGGVYVGWWPSGPQGATVHLQHVRADGSLAPGWPEGGKRMFGIDTYADQLRLASDQMGGVFVGAELVGEAQHLRVYVQHVTPNGSFDGVWGALGLRLVPQTIVYDQAFPRLCPSLPGSVIVCWNDARSLGDEAYAARVSLDGVVAATLSLVSQEVSADRVALAWRVGGGTVRDATIERRCGSEPWRALATLLPDGTGMLRYEDRDIVPGNRYGYRLAWNEVTGPQQTAETWIEVPLASRFALAGASPNPSPRAALSVAYSLAEHAPARLELYDAQGRAVARHELGAIEPGAHLERFAEATGLRAGLYWLRLAQGAHSATARVVLVD